MLMRFSSFHKNKRISKVGSNTGVSVTVSTNLIRRLSRVWSSPIKCWCHDSLLSVRSVLPSFSFQAKPGPNLPVQAAPHWRDVRCLTGRAGSLKVTPTPLLCQWENVRQFIWNLNKEQRTDYFICCSLFMKLISTRALASVALRSYFEQNEAVSRLLWTRSVVVLISLWADYYWVTVQTGN